MQSTGTEDKYLNFITDFRLSLFGLAYYIRFKTAYNQKLQKITSSFFFVGGAIISSKIICFQICSKFLQVDAYLKASLNHQLSFTALEQGSNS